MFCNDCHVTYLNSLELICAMVQNMVQKVSKIFSIYFYIMVFYSFLNLSLKFNTFYHFVLS